MTENYDSSASEPIRPITKELPVQLGDPRAIPTPQIPTSPSQYSGGDPYGNASAGQAPAAWTPPGAPQKTNVLSIVAIVGAFVMAPVGLICGIIALTQTKETGEKGRGFA